MPTLGGHVSQEVYDKWDKVAEEEGTTKSKIVGQALSTSKIINTKKIEDIELKKLQALHRIEEEKKAIGRLLNQVARHCNIHKRIDLGVLRALEEIDRNFR